MSSVQSLREFISERLTAAAEEIFTEVEKTIVRYEEEINRQRRLLDLSWKPQTHLHTTELPQHCVWKDEVLTDQQLYNQERNSSSDQEEPEPPQMKQEEICTGQDEEQLSVKQEYETFMVTPAYEESNRKKPEPAQEEPEPAQEEPEPPQQEELCIGQDEEQLLLMQETEKRNHWEPQQNIFQNKTEFDHQHRTLEISWSPQIKLHRIDLPQHHTWKEDEVLTDQWLSNQERNSCSDQEEPGLPQIKEEHQDPEPPQENPKTLEMKEEQQTETFMVTPVYKERNHGELEPNRDQWFSLNSSESENQVQEGGSKTDSGLSRDEELKQNKRSSQTRGHDDNVDHPKVKRNPKKCFVCSTCGRKFSVKYSLNVHMKLHTSEKPFTCQICGKSYSVKNSFKYHMKTHTGERPFSCKTCGKSFISRCNLNPHMRTHTSEKPFSCQTCGKSFISRCNLNAHMRTHTGERPFTCQICGKSYSEKNSFKYHMKIHTGEKPFSCETCGKSYICRGDLKAHVKIHTGEKPFSCKTCGKSFTFRCSLNIHMKTHTGEKPFSCEACGKRYICRGDLNDHVKTHTVEKPFSCKTCGKSFTSRSALSVHVKTHTGEKPFSCKTCGKSFSFRSVLNVHVKKHM